MEIITYAIYTHCLPCSFKTPSMDTTSQTYSQKKKIPGIHWPGFKTYGASDDWNVWSCVLALLLIIARQNIFNLRGTKIKKLIIKHSFPRSGFDKASRDNPTATYTYCTRSDSWNMTAGSKAVWSPGSFVWLYDSGMEKGMHCPCAWWFTLLLWIQTVALKISCNIPKYCGCSFA